MDDELPEPDGAEADGAEADGAAMESLEDELHPDTIKEPKATTAIRRATGDEFTCPILPDPLLAGG